MWCYRGTTDRIKIGDTVRISERWAKELRVERLGKVVGLSGFITVKLSNGDNVDFDQRSISKP